MNQPHRRDIPPSWSADTTTASLDLGRTWLASPALRDLVQALGGPEFTEPGRDLPALIRWSSQVLDTRRGAERQAAAPVALAAAHITALLEAAGPLGLLSTPPPRLPAYDVTVVLGGTTTGNELRTGLAHTVATTGTSIGTLIGLSAERPLTEAERTTSHHHTECEHLESVLSSAFAQTQPGPARMLTAMPSRPGRRADTEDAIRHLATQIPPPQRQRVLLVTSAIYASYQFFVIAPLLLADGSHHVELIGTPTAANGAPGLLAQRIAQEIHATITTIARRLTGSSPA